VSGQLHNPAALLSVEEPPVRLGGPRAALEDVEKGKFLSSLILELRPLGRPDRSQSLYRLRYPDSSERWLYLL
jgi:hypothetical protein